MTFGCFRRLFLWAVRVYRVPRDNPTPKFVYCKDKDVYTVKY
jgi:hypothetical protein